MLENITDSMNDSGYEGKWYSYIDNLQPYRVRLLDDEYTVWKVTDYGQSLIDAPEILKQIRKHVK